VPIFTRKNLSTIQASTTQVISICQSFVKMSIIKLLCFFSLATELASASSKNVPANLLTTGQLLPRPSSGTSLTSTLVPRVLEEHSDCHCVGTSVHCSNQVTEAFCSCANETLFCTDPFEGCHCDGSLVQCDDSAVESACHCEEGTVHCE
jgi:hypothetical protein